MYAKFLCFFLLFFLVGWQDSQLADHVRIPVSLTLKNHVKVDRPIVYLSDISTCKSYQSICDESYGIEIARLKNPDDRIRISRKEVKYILGVEWPQAQIEISGNIFTVPVVGMGVLPDKKEVANLLEKNLPHSEMSRFHIEYVNVTKKIWINDAFDIDLKKGWWNDYILSPKELVLKTTSFQNLPIRLRLKKQCRSFVAKNNMSKNDKAKARDFEKKWVRCESGLVQKIPGNMLIKHHLLQGRSLKHRHLISVYALKRGERKKVTFQVGSLTLESFLIAQEKGKPGDTIRFKNIKTRKIVYGKIYPDGHVEIL